MDLYLFAFERRLAGVYNAGFENLEVGEIARLVTTHVPAEIKTLPSNDPRSYSVLLRSLAGDRIRAEEGRVDRDCRDGGGLPGRPDQGRADRL